MNQSLQERKGRRNTKRTDCGKPEDNLYQTAENWKDPIWKRGDFVSLGTLSRSGSICGEGKLPQCLCIHLQRLSWSSQGTPLKRNEHVQFSELLSLDTYKYRSPSQRLGHRRLNRPASTGSLPRMLEATMLNKPGSTQPSQSKMQVANGACSSSLLSASFATPPSPVTRSYTSSVYLFRLMSVVVHHGDIHSGHFVTYRRSPSTSKNPMAVSSQWLWISDDTVRRASLQEVLTSNAYLLFYERVRPLFMRWTSRESNGGENPGLIQETIGCCPVAKKRHLSEVSEEESENEKERNQEEDGMRTPVKKVKGGPWEGEEAAAAAAKPSSPLSPEQLSRIERNKQAALLRLATRNVPEGFGESWRKELMMEFAKPYFIKLMGFVALERKRCTVYPPPHQVFMWTETCNICDVKVVILGQDPYHGPNQAHGLCFSVKRPVPPPPSLENMYKELQSDIEGFEHPGHGDLTGWAKQGVLLLNAVLTVRAHQANSHKERGWEDFTDAVVSWLNNNRDGVVFMLWGAYAQRKGSAIDRTRHHVLQAVHPSPLSAHRGFFGCKHFSRTNEFLKKSGKAPINWKLL
ncbi:uncharacterized protein [Heptranchias perlo]|uniref:uncharacterized protein isoform X5 n=1 Tax=Heptranchias perlo TaxID=212740 RepID=UPI00355ACC63